ncbi:hypothetical protein ACNGB2_00470 [Campylobacter coli]|nr:hypothetical protein [Campylobacter coli]HEG8179640.1 hypothetical protein [Campylobacter jejuni]HEG8181429.1 hypothetical protein [Campylobacter coli]
MILDIIIIVLLIGLGVILGLFIYKNNKEKMDNFTDKTENTFDDLKNKINKNVK